MKEKTLWYVLTLIALGLSCTLFTVPASALKTLIFPQEVWSNRYPANAGYKWPVTLEATSSDVYVTGIAQVDHGETNEDYVTVKYSSKGQQAWAKLYNGTANRDDIATTMALASQGTTPVRPSDRLKPLRSGGHLYVAGTSKGTSGTGSDFLTVKYSTSGSKVWERRYNSPENQDEIAAAVAVDQFNNVFVTGSSGTFALTGGTSNYLTVKYNSAGTKVWEATYDGNGAPYNLALANAVDKQGNVYVSGYSGDFNHLDIVTVKFGPNGNYLWEQRYPGPNPWALISGVLDNFKIIKVMLALDPQGNVVVAGPSLGQGTEHDYITLKYSSNGTRLWGVVYNSLASNKDDIPTAMALDAQGNVYVTGYSEYQDSCYIIVTLKYDGATGNPQHAAWYDDGSHANYATAISLDGAGNVYVAGESSGEFVTIRYNGATLEQQWVAHKAGLNGDSSATDIMCIPGTADLYVTGYSKSVEGDGYDIVTVRYHQVTWSIVVR
jgi:hypothetical protein